MTSHQMICHLSDSFLLALGATMHRFTARHDFSSAVHPLFGPLTEPEWKRWGYLHADHHLRQFHA